ncbi:MAG: hypothetical protein ABI813_11035, partial [Bacteroidota bacterium]
NCINFYKYSHLAPVKKGSKPLAANSALLVKPGSIQDNCEYIFIFFYVKCDADNNPLKDTWNFLEMAQ